MAPHAQQLSGMDHATLVTLRDRHPAWRLLASPHAPLVTSFLHRAVVVPNARVRDILEKAKAYFAKQSGRGTRSTGKAVPHSMARASTRLSTAPSALSRGHPLSHPGIPQ